MKKVLFLVDDYWHKGDTIKPLAGILFSQDDWTVVYTTNPDDLYDNTDIDLLISFKDPIENDQIPTPVWCDDKWNETFLKMIESGVGFIAVHAATTDLDENHPLVSDLIHAVFVNHPEQCEVSIRVSKAHPICEGVKDFTLPVFDEHYQMKILDDKRITILAETVSKNGIQPGLWVSEFGKGRICCFTPGHTTDSLVYDGYVKIMKNAIDWCIRMKD